MFLFSLCACLAFICPLSIRPKMLSSFCFPTTCSILVKVFDESDSNKPSSFLAMDMSDSNKSLIKLSLAEFTSTILFPVSPLIILPISVLADFLILSSFLTLAANESPITLDGLFSIASTGSIESLLACIVSSILLT